MRKNTSGFIGILISVIAVIVLGIVAVVIGPRLLRSSTDRAVGTGNSGSENKTTYAKEDINQDGKIDYLDEILLKNNVGCKVGESCWEKVVGYTISGHNPLYVKELDLVGDGVIDQKDIDIVSK